MNDQELKEKCKLWALNQEIFPLSKQWVIKDHILNPPPCSNKKLTKLFGDYNTFRSECGVPILQHHSNDSVTLEVLQRDCVEQLISKNPEITTPCWVWQKHLNKGYPQKKINNKTVRVHKYVHEIICDNPKPSENHSIDHICQNPACIAPDHLRWATITEQAKNTNRTPNTKVTLITPPAASLQERLNWYLSKVIEDSNGCWVIPKLPTKSGYIRISYNNKEYSSHIIFKLYSLDKNITQNQYETFIKSNIIRHTCNNKTCTNPAHLQIGTGKEGNRQNSLDSRSYHSGYKLSIEDIPEIRYISNDLKDNGWSNMNIYKHIASIYSVSPITISHVIQGRTWSDIK